MNEKIRILAEQYRLTFVILFGSQATGKTHRESDVDIAYQSVEPLSLREEGKLILDLMPIFKTNKIDLVALHNAPPLLLNEIVRTGRVLYERIPAAFVDFYLYARRVYDESRPLFRLRSEYVHRKIAALSRT